MSDQARYQRFVQDAALTAAVALPAAGSTAFSATIDLGAAEPGSIVDNFDVLVSIDATPNLANGQTVTAILQQSPDNATWVQQPVINQFVVTGPANGGGPQTLFVFKLPPNVQQYLRLEVIVGAGAGNVTANNATLALVF